MREIEYDLEDELLVGNHIRSMMETPGFKILLQFLKTDRERIIQEGKKARAEEKQVKNWALLAGFDLVTERVVYLSKLGEKKEDQEAFTDE